MSTGSAPQPTSHHWTTGSVRTASGLSLLAGLWMMASPFIVGFVEVEAGLWNALIDGALVVILASVRLGAPHRLSVLSGLVALVGLWLILSPFICHYAEANLAASNAWIIGAVIALSGVWGAISTPHGRTAATGWRKG